MEPEIEIYYRTIDPIESRERFLEKEMLDSDVHHLEVRTFFFDHLAVIAGGSIALGITFLASGLQNGAIVHVIKQHLSFLAISLVIILLSLILSLVHNFMTSCAVANLSKQLESLYHSAHEMTEWKHKNLLLLKKQLDGSENLVLNQKGPEGTKRAEIDAYNAEADQFQNKNEKLVGYTNRVGTHAIVFLILGYVIGLTEIVLIIAAV